MANGIFVSARMFGARDGALANLFAPVGPGPEIYPSQADVAAINLMYPPVPNPMPPPGGNAGPAVPADAPAPPFGPGGPLELPANVGRP